MYTVCMKILSGALFFLAVMFGLFGVYIDMRTPDYLYTWNTNDSADTVSSCSDSSTPKVTKVYTFTEYVFVHTVGNGGGFEKSELERYKSNLGNCPYQINNIARYTAPYDIYFLTSACALVASVLLYKSYKNKNAVKS